MPYLLRSITFGATLFIMGATAIVPLHAQTVAQPSQAPRDVAQEERNRKLVLDFYDGVFNKHEVAKAAQVLVDSYIQHNPGVPDGKSPFVNYFTGFFKENPNARARIVRSAADGDLVFLHVHSTNGENDKGRAIVDVFRVENDRIVEHWDVIQKVPDASANNNTMF